QAIRGRAAYSEAVGFGEIDHRLIILRRRPKCFGELGHAEEMAVVGAGWVVKPAQQAVQIPLVAEGQHDGNVQALSGCKNAHWRGLPAADDGAHVIVQYLRWLLGLSRNWEQQESGCAEQCSQS